MPQWAEIEILKSYPRLFPLSDVFVAEGCTCVGGTGQTSFLKGAKISNLSCHFDIVLSCSSVLFRTQIALKGDKGIEQYGEQRQHRPTQTVHTQRDIP